MTLDDEQERLLKNIVGAFAAYKPGDERKLCSDCKFRPPCLGYYCSFAERITPVSECEHYSSFVAIDNNEE